VDRKEEKYNKQFVLGTLMLVVGMVIIWTLFGQSFQSL